MKVSARGPRAALNLPRRFRWPVRFGVPDLNHCHLTEMQEKAGFQGGNDLWGDRVEASELCIARIKFTGAEMAHGNT